jgi:putative tricarboxylic transport membrane protein
MMFDALASAFASAMHIDVLIAVFAGTVIGVVIGALPGLTATMGMALLSPFTFFLSPVVGIGFLIGLYKGGTFGGTISAVLIGTPGTASNAATMLDGYVLARKGEAGRALGLSLWGSVAGDIFGSACLIIGAPLIGAIALKFGNPEFFALTVFSLTMVAYVSGNSLAKGIMAASIGLVLALVGGDPIGGSPRFTFGIPELSAGIGVIPLAIGLFGMAEVLIQLGSYIHGTAEKPHPVRHTPFPALIRELKGYWRTILQSSAIGAVIGALPGVGAETSNWVAYGLAKRFAKDPESFGKGNVEGVIAPEVSANSVCGASFIPTLLFGIPGDIVTAILMGALIAQGLEPGPTLITEHADVFYALYITMFTSMVFLAIVGMFAIRWGSHILRVPRPLLFAAITVLCFAGTYAINASLFDVGMMILFGILGWGMRKLDIPVAPLILAFILCGTIENSIRRMLVQSGGSLAPLVERPIALTFLVLTALVVISIIHRQVRGVPSPSHH